MIHGYCKRAEGDIVSKLGEKYKTEVAIQAQKERFLKVETIGLRNNVQL